MSIVNLPGPAQQRNDRAPAASGAQAWLTNHLEFADEVSRLRPYLLRFAGRRLRDRAVLEDLVQDTLLAALRGAASFEGRASLRTWLTSILLRRIADHVREQQRRTAAQVASQLDDVEDDNRPELLQSVSSEAIDSLDPQRQLEGRQFLQALAEGLKDMPAQAAQVFALREINGLSNDEAAHQLGLSPGNAAQLLYRTRLRLRSLLAARELQPALV